MKHTITLTVNGDDYSLSVDPWRTSNEVLREDLNLTGTKYGCGSGDCRACTVLVDDQPVSSCLTLAVEVNGKFCGFDHRLQDGDVVDLHISVSGG